MGKTILQKAKHPWIKLNHVALLSISFSHTVQGNGYETPPSWDWAMKQQVILSQKSIRLLADVNTG